MNTVHLTPKSANAKTGPIPVSTSTKRFCPDTCSLKGNGCYAESGPLAVHWRKVSSGERGMSWDAFCSTVASFDDGQLWRHNQAGDLPGDGKTIDEIAMAQLVKANTGKRGFTYTHYPMDSDVNRRAVHSANAFGLTVNLSAESILEADKLKALNVGPVVTVMPETEVKSFTSPAGNTVVVCPTTYRDDTSCATCQLCQRQRESIVAFPVHGTSKAKALKVFMLKNVTH